MRVDSAHSLLKQGGTGGLRTGIGMETTLTVKLAGRAIDLVTYTNREALAKDSELQERPSGLLLDLRRGCEVAEAPLPAPGEGWEVRPLPTRGETVSEQDLDILRRCLLQCDVLALVGPSARLVAAALQARQNRTEIPEDEAAPYRQSDPALLEWLTAYLQRHRETELTDEFVLAPVAKT